MNIIFLYICVYWHGICTLLRLRCILCQWCAGSPSSRTGRAKSEAQRFESSTPLDSTRWHLVHSGPDTSSSLVLWFCQVLCFDIRCFQSCSQILVIILFGHLRTTTGGWKWWKQMFLAKIWLMLVDAGGLQCSRRFQRPWRSRYPDGSRSPVFHWKILD